MFYSTLTDQAKKALAELPFNVAIKIERAAEREMLRSGKDPNETVLEMTGQITSRTKDRLGVIARRDQRYEETHRSFQLDQLFCATEPSSPNLPRNLKSRERNKEKDKFSCKNPVEWGAIMQITRTLMGMTVVDAATHASVSSSTWGGCESGGNGRAGAHFESFCISTELVKVFEPNADFESLAEKWAIVQSLKGKGEGPHGGRLGRSRSDIAKSLRDSTDLSFGTLLSRLPGADSSGR